MNVWVAAVTGGTATTLLVLSGVWWHRQGAASRRLRRISRDRTRSRHSAPAGGSRMVWTAVAGGVVVTVAVGLIGGPVAAVIVAAYSAVAFVHWRAVLVRRAVERERQAAVDAIGALAAELRAGLAPDPELLATLASDGEREPASGGRQTGPVLRRADPVLRRAAARVEAARAISEGLGAPMADLLDRVELDLRADQRLRTVVAAQTGGTRTTAALLAALPVAGLGLGSGFSVNPLDVLLHTQLGNVSAVLALLLQVGGLAWSDRLTRSAVEAVT